jgi:hypothetical protein
VLGVVLPLLAAAVASASVSPIASADLGLGPVHVLLAVDVDVVVAVLLPAAAPVVVVHVDVVVAPVAAVADERADAHADAEREEARHRHLSARVAGVGVAGRVAVRRRVVRLRRRRAVCRRRILRHVHGVRLGRLDDDRLLLVDDLLGDLLLLGGLERAAGLGQLPHALHRVQHVVLLGEEGVAKVLRPVEVLGHALQEVGELRETLDARVPVLLRERLVEVVALEVLVLAPPAVRLDDLERVGRGDQHLDQERVGVERDGAD